MCTVILVSSLRLWVPWSQEIVHILISIAWHTTGTRQLNNWRKKVTLWQLHYQYVQVTHQTLQVFLVMSLRPPAHLHSAFCCHAAPALVTPGLDYSKSSVVFWPLFAIIGFVYCQNNRSSVHMLCYSFAQDCLTARSCPRYKAGRVTGSQSWEKPWWSSRVTTCCCKWGD